MKLLSRVCESFIDPAFIRYQELGGVNHLVAPITPLVQGVLTASNVGVPELALASEFGKNLPMWNGRPITLGHPVRRGEAISAGDPAVMDTQVIGMFFNASLDGDRIRGEMWINLDLVDRIGERAKIQVDRILAGDEQIEVSSGFFSELDPIPGIYGEHEDYVGVQRNHMPDHIALLDPGDIGACSWQDGCGVRANIAGDEMKILKDARSPRFSGVTDEKSTDHSFKAYADAWAQYSGESAPKDLDSGGNPFRIFVANHSLLGIAQGKSFDEIICVPVVDPKTEKLNSNLLHSLVMGQCECEHIDNIPSGALKSAKAMASGLLQSHFDHGLKPNAGHDDDDETKHKGSDADLRDAIKAALNAEGRYYSGIPHIFADEEMAIITRPHPDTFELEFFQRGFKMLADGKIQLAEEEVRVRQETRFLPASAGKEGSKVKTNQERASALITDGTWEEDDRVLLEGMTDAQLSKLEINVTPSHNAESTECECADCVALRANKTPPLTLPDRMTMEQCEALLPSELVRALKRGQEEESRERSHLVTAIRGIRANVFTEVELKAKPIEELRQLGAFANVPDYSLRNAGVSATTSNAVPPTEKLFSPAA